MIYFPNNQEIPNDFQKFNEKFINWGHYKIVEIEYVDPANCFIKACRILAASLIAITLVGLAFQGARNFINYAFYTQFETRVAYDRIPKRTRNLNDQELEPLHTSILIKSKIASPPEKFDSLMINVSRVINPFLTDIDLHNLAQASTHQYVRAFPELEALKKSNKAFKEAIDHIPTSKKEHAMYGNIFIPYSEDERTERFTRLMALIPRIEKVHINRIWSYKHYDKDGPSGHFNLLLYAIQRLNDREKLLEVAIALIQRGIDLSFVLVLKPAYFFRGSRQSTLEVAQQHGHPELVACIEAGLEGNHS
jgi:hypothetical protein